MNWLKVEDVITAVEFQRRVCRIVGPTTLTIVRLQRIHNCLTLVVSRQRIKQDVVLFGGYVVNGRARVEDD